METLHNIDSTEIEYEFFKLIQIEFGGKTPDLDKSLALFAISIGIIDYQDKSNNLWSRLQKRLLQGTSFPNTITQIQNELCNFISTRRIAKNKLARLNKLYKSTFPENLWSNLDSARAHFLDTWKRLAAAMKEPEDTKTIVLGIKMFRAQTFAIKGDYPKLTGQIPIITDIRILKLAVASGIMNLDKPTSALALKYKKELIEVWDKVLTEINSTRQKPIDMFCLDSLLWKLFEYKSKEEAVEYLLRYGVNESTANEIADCFDFSVL